MCRGVAATHELHMSSDLHTSIATFFSGTRSFGLGPVFFKEKNAFFGGPNFLTCFLKCGEMQIEGPSFGCLIFENVIDRWIEAKQFLQV